MNVWKIILFPSLTKICANIVDRMFWIKAFYEHSNNVGHESFPIYFYIDMMFSCKINQLKLKTCKTRKNCFRYLKLMSPLNAAICTTISYTLWVEWYYLKNNYLTLRSKVKVPRKWLRYATHRLMVMHPYTNYHWPISNDKNIMARRRKYYLKNNYLTLRSNVKVPRRSLWYVTHRLMVMHPHTKYHWPIWKDKKVMVRESIAEKKRKKKRKKKSD